MTIGFIGGGNMGGAIIGGIVESKSAEPANIYVYDVNTDAVTKLKDQYGIQQVVIAQAAVNAADILFLCVKPNVLYNVINEIKDNVSENTLIISIAAGQSIDAIENAFGKEIKLIRVMPNTPALVGEGMSALSPNGNVTNTELETAVELFNSFGKAEVVPEKLMDTVTAVSGSSPAYVFMFIEAMADAAVMGGMPRQQAYTFAAQSVLGSAKMVLETGKHPGELKDMVCSPAGTTIEAVAVLEDMGLRAAVIEAMRACMEKSQSM